MTTSLSRSFSMTWSSGVQDPLGLRCGLPDVLADQVVPHGVDQMTFFQVAEPVQKVCHPQGHGGLSRPGRPGEAHVQVGPGCGQAELVPGPVNQEQCRDLLDFLLHRQQPDQVPSRASKTSSMSAARRSAAKVTVASSGSSSASLRSLLRRAGRRGGMRGGVCDSTVRNGVGASFAVTGVVLLRDQMPRNASTTG
jgi:hypothetical protein